MDNLFSLRFFVAPVLSLLFIVLALPEVAAGTLLTAVAFSVDIEVVVLFIFMSGFLVSAIASFLINLFKIDIISFTKDEYALLIARYPFLESRGRRAHVIKEFAEWLIMEDTGSVYIRDQVQARWSMFVVYFTSFIALMCIVLPTVFAMGLTLSALWWGMYALFSAVFLYNAMYYYASVNSSVKIMLDRLVRS